MPIIKKINNDVKSFSEVIKTEFLTSERVEKRYPIFFRSTRFDNVKVLEESKANTILRYMLRYFLKFVALRIFT